MCLIINKWIQFSPRPEPRPIGYPCEQSIYRNKKITLDCFLFLQALEPSEIDPVISLNRVNSPYIDLIVV